VSEVVIGRRRVKVRAKKKARVSITLSKSGKTLLRSRRKLKGRATLSSKNGIESASAFTLTASRRS
jgi:hypothetical protein